MYDSKTVIDMHNRIIALLEERDRKAGIINRYFHLCVDQDKVIQDQRKQLRAAQKKIRKPQQKITQLVIMPIITPELEVVDSLEETERGDGGFGSTGAF